MSDKVKTFLLFFIGLIISAGFDQWTKKLAVEKLMNKNPFVLIDGVFEFHYSENRGAAFGILQGKQIAFYIIAAVVIVGVLYVLYKMPADKKYLPLIFTLFLLTSGAIGNLIDRAVQQYVVDFLYFKLIDFPIFNVADCYVVCATFMLIMLVVFYYKDEDFNFISVKKDNQEK